MLDFQNFLGLNKILNVINCYLNIIVQEKFFVRSLGCKP